MRCSTACTMASRSAGGAIIRHASHRRASSAPAGRSSSTSIRTWSLGESIGDRSCSIARIAGRLVPGLPVDRLCVPLVVMHRPAAGAVPWLHPARPAGTLPADEHLQRLSVAFQAIDLVFQGLDGQRHVGEQVRSTGLTQGAGA
ncbi:MAG: hypothetical protein KatS3mg103_0955 [Phycisphaerales bacterium]|nr:MAG: hypothetical protein KatS3mg103_0955 [Phycisphaerales bacterium]